MNKVIHVPGDDVFASYIWKLGAPAYVYVTDDDLLADVFARGYVRRALEAENVKVLDSNAEACALLLKRLAADEREGRTVTSSRPVVLITKELDDDLRAVLRQGRTERIYVLFVGVDGIPQEVRDVAVDVQTLQVVPADDDD